MNNQKKSFISLNENKLKIFMIIIDIIVLISICSSYYILTYQENTPTNTTQYFVFKNFKYKLSENIKFTNYDEYKFKIESDNWYAIIEPSIDKEKQIYNTDISYKLLKKYKFNISKPEELIIDNTKVIKYEKYDTKTLLCYFITKEEYGFEIEIYNKDKSFNNQSINEIIKILNNYEYDNSKTYEYVIINLSKIEIDENDELVIKNDKTN